MPLKQSSRTCSANMWPAGATASPSTCSSATSVYRGIRLTLADNLDARAGFITPLLTLFTTSGQ